jgi:tripartite-type tricarboxylate transporter receptor subunit TctC
MMRISRVLAVALALSPLPIIGAAPVRAQPSDFYAGKTVKMIVGLGFGGGYDLWGRTLARFIGRHLPGKPAVIVQNMEGAGSYRAANYFQSVAPRDGTVIGLIARDAALGPITGAPGAQFDPPGLTWIGTPTLETNVCMSYKTAAVKTVRDLADKQLTVGDNGPGTGTGTYPKALNALLGLKFRVVGGYASSADVFLAMERGEVEGYCESLDSITGKRPDWIATRTVNILFQGGAHPHTDLEGVPYVPDLAKNDNDRKAIEFLYAGQGIGRPFLAPPGLPPERTKALRDAFDATMQDAEFIAEAKARKLNLEPQNGDYLDRLINKIYATPKPIVEKIGALIK